MNKKTESALPIVFDAVGGDLRDLLKEVKEHWGPVSTEKFSASAFAKELADETGPSIAELGECSPSECRKAWREAINRKRERQPVVNLQGQGKPVIVFGKQQPALSSRRSGPGWVPSSL